MDTITRLRSNAARARARTFEKRTLQVVVQRGVLRELRCVACSSSSRASAARTRARRPAALQRTWKAARCAPPHVSVCLRSGLTPPPFRQPVIYHNGQNSMHLFFLDNAKNAAQYSDAVRGMGRLGELRRARLRCTHAHARTHVPAGVQRRLTGARGGGNHHGLHASTVSHQPPPSSVPRAACLWPTRRTRPRRTSGSSTSREGSGPPPSQLPRCRAAAHLRSSSPTAARRTLLRSRSRSPVVLLQVLGRAVLHAASQAHAAAHILQVSERRPALAGGGPHDRHLRRGQQAQSLGGRQSDLRGLLLQRRCAAKCSSHPVPPPGNVS